MGAIGGSVFHSIKGVRNAPTGHYRRLMGGLLAVKERAPITGGRFPLAYLSVSLEII